MVNLEKNILVDKELPEIAVRVLADEISKCQDPLKRELLISDFFSKLQSLPKESYYWNLADTFLSEFPDRHDPHRLKPSIEKKMSTIVLVITVRSEEISSLKETFPDDQYPEITSSQALEFDIQQTFHRGKFSSGFRTVEMFLVQQIETGQHEAAAVTTRYIHRIREITGTNPDYAVLTGICAGSRRRENIDFGDVVVPPHIFDESVYKITRQDDHQKIYPELRTPGKPHEHLLRLCLEISKKKDIWNNPNFKHVDGHKFPPDVHLDPAITGNAFIEDPEYMKKCQELYNRKIAAYEMEAGGFAKACHGEDVPFVVIRGMSDWADQDAIDESWRSYASRTASIFMYELLKCAAIPSRR